LRDIGTGAAQDQKYPISEDYVITQYGIRSACIRKIQVSKIARIGAHQKIYRNLQNGLN